MIGGMAPEKEVEEGVDGEGWLGFDVVFMYRARLYFFFSYGFLD